jgi:hypothetical protein
MKSLVVALLLFAMPLRIDQLLLLIQGALQAFAQNLSGGGTVSIATDPFNVFELLGVGSRNYMLILHWAGDENVNDYDLIPMLRHRIELVFGANLGLAVQPDGALLAGNQNRPPIYQSLDDVRALMLGFRFSGDQTEPLFAYVRAEPVVTPQGMPLAAFRLLFTLRALPPSPNQPTTIE